jgi:hypothetical protein
MSQDRTFERYIQKWIREYGTADRLSSAIGMSLSAFSRGVRNEQTLGVVSLLKFCEETGEPFDKVLHLAGKSEAARLIKKLAGPAAKTREPLSGPLREHMDEWQLLTPDERAPLDTIIKTLVARRKK